MPQPLGCKTPLITIPGTGYNHVSVPGPGSKGYTSITDEILYEIWQTLLLILAAQNPPGVNPIIKFTIGDGQVGTPVTGTTSLHVSMIQGVSLINKDYLVIREGIALRYSTAVTHNDIVRFNDGAALGGFDFDGTSGLSFQTGEEYMIVVTGTNTTIAP